MALAINAEAEQKAIITILNNPPMSGKLLGVVGPDHFAEESAIEVLARVLRRVQAGKDIPKREIMLTDPALSDGAKEYLANIDVKPVREEESCEHLIEILNFHKKIRTILRTVTSIKDACKVATPETVHELEGKIDQLTLDSKGAGGGPRIISFGQGDKEAADEVIQRVVVNSRAGFIPTGFDYFDGRAGGFRKGHAVLIAGPTGGGKSALANQLLCNMYLKAHLKTLMISFEMNDEECVGRMIATCSGIEHDKIEQRRLSIAEAQQITKWKAEFDKAGDDNDCWFRLWNPDEDLTSSNVISYARPLAPDVIVVDYIGLLAQDDSREEQWKALGSAMRRFKIAAKKLNCAIVVLAQFDQDAMVVKYSRALQEHANIMWSWLYGPQEEATGAVCIRQTKPMGKNRNCAPFDFMVRFELKYMRITDAGATDATNKLPQPTKKRGADTNARKLPVARSLPGLEDDD